MPHLPGRANLSKQCREIRASIGNSDISAVHHMLTNIGGAFNAGMRSSTSMYGQGTVREAQLELPDPFNGNGGFVFVNVDMFQAAVPAQGLSKVRGLHDAARSRCLILPVVKVQLNDPCGTPSLGRV